MSTNQPPKDTPASPGGQQALSSPKIMEMARNVPLTVQRVDRPEGPRHAGRLVGHIQTTYLVIGGFQDVAFEKGESLLVRMLLESEAMAYQAIVKHVVDAPRMYFITFPETVQSINLRKHERIRVFMPADLRAAVADDVRLGTVMLVNISAGGCGFTTTNPLPEGQALTLSFVLPGQRLTLTMAGTVLECRRRGEVHYHRVRFEDSPDNRNAQAAIAGWVTEIGRFALE